MKAKFNKLFTLLTILTLGISNVWGAYAPENNPATKTYAELTFLDVANTKANGKITATGATFEGDSTLAYSLRYVGQTLAITSWYNCSDGSPASNFESSPTYADAEINGFVVPSSTSGNIGYGGAKAHSGRVRYFYATGITSVAIISHDNGSSKYVQLKIEEVASNGDLSAVTTIDSPNKSSSTLSLIEYTTALSPTKYYKISCTSNNSSNCKVYQIRFGKYIAPATTYTVTYKSGDGTGADVVDNAATTVADCPGTFSYAGHDFAGWKDAGDNDVAVGATVSSDMTLTAQWVTHVEKFTVVYKDGTTELGSEVVNVGDVPAGIAAPTKDCYTFAGWDPALSGVSGTDGATVEVNATWTPVYSSSATLISDENVSTKANVNTIFAASNIVSSITFTSGNYEFTSNDTKPGYYGYKDKASGDYMKIMLQQGKRVRVLFGNLGADPTITINGAAGALDAARATGDNAENTFTYTATSADALIVITMGSGTNTLKKVDILQLYTATYIDDENGNSSENNVAQVTLGTPTGSKTFMGWKADQAVTVDDEVVAANTTIAGGKTAVLSANTTFTAQWSDAAFTVTYYDGATELGSENVVSGGNPVNYADYQTKAMATFDGWYSDSELNTPIADISALTITANTPVYGKWTSTDARLSAIEFSSNAGTLSPAFDPEVVNYTYTMPYGTAAIPTITGATAVNANAKEPVIVQQASAWNETAIIRGVAQSDDTKAYNITMKIAPKDGVSIIKVETTGGTNKTVTGLYAGDGDVNLSSSKKMDGGKYIGFTLDGTALQAGDQINVHTTQASSTGGSHIIFYDNMTDKNELYDTEEIGGVGDNIFTINAAMVGATTAYVYRSDADNPHKWNGYIDYIEVTRIMNPMLTAITINGEAGTINESLKTVAVELQPGYDLDALSIVTTIVSNTDEALVVKTVESNGGNWIIGDNTYRLTDKDGDYTDYTVTLSVGEVKHTVTFDAQGGSAVDPQQVVDGGNPAVPTAPTKDDYIFQGWSETTDGAVVDVTSFTITAPKTFYAIWVSDGAIKLLDGSTVNHTNFITGVTADETVEFQGNTVNYAKFSGMVSGVNGVKDLTRVIAYNATTNKTKIQISAHNNSTSARNILVKGVVEGSTDVEDLATIALGNKEDKVSDWIEFNNAANRTIYIFVGSSAGDVYFTQVKVIESGETPMKHAGEEGYALNFNQGRFFGVKDVTAHFEGLNVEVASSDCQPLNTSVVKLANSSISFDVAAPVLMTVTTNNNKTYYVTEGSAGTDNETAKTGASEFHLTAGTWYITGGGSNVEITNIAFSAPKCEAPVFNGALADIELCAGDPFSTAFDGTATVGDGGTVTYKWYAEGADETDPAAVLGTNATYTPNAEGNYYVIATNSLSGFADNSTKSALVNITQFATAQITTAPMNQRGAVDAVVTLSVVATGKNVSYKWYTCDNEAGDNEVAIDPAETGTSLSVTITAGMAQWYKVKVMSDCGNVDATAKVEEFVPATPQNVTESTTWDWKSTTAGFPTENSSIDFANTSVEELLANVSSLMPNNDAFHSDMLYGIGQRAWRKSNNDGECGFQGFQLRFHTEVAGRVRVYFRAPSSGQTSVVRINGNEAGSRANSWGWSQYIYVDANSDVVIAMTNGETGMTRVQKMEFQTPDYTRTAMLGNGVLGTLCVDHNVPVEGIQGATFYELVGRNTEGKIAFDQITTGQLEAGVPYVFQANGDKLVLYYGNTKVDDPVNGNGMYGTFTDITLPDDVPAMENLNDIYYFAQKALWSCTDLTSLSIPANRAYVKLSEIPSAMAPAPGRIRMTLNVNGAPQVVTGVENLENNETPVKMIIDGQLFILRGEKLYDATGRLVK